MTALPTSLPALDTGVVAALIEGRHAQPHSVLGPHAIEGGWAIRVLRPLAESVAAEFTDGTRVHLAHTTGGLWQAFVPDAGRAATGLSSYRIRARYSGGTEWSIADAYSFAPTIGELDLYLWSQGRHEQVWQVLGAHPRQIDGVNGTGVTVWAPHAQAVRLLGDHNAWNGSAYMLRRLDDTGVWELFVPDLAVGGRYKFQLLTASGSWVTRADPMAQATQVPPDTASIVGQTTHVWDDGGWMSARAARAPHSSPMSVYELHLGSWRPGLGYRELADPLIEYVGALGFTHVEFLPLAEHPYGPSWGYQVTGYYAPTSRFGTADDLKYLIDRLHQAGIGVLLDWVPAHFPKDEWALANFDGQTLYEHGDPRRGEHPDWGTLVFDFGNSQVRNFLVANALFWLEEFHVDGLRVDAVASMLYLDYSRNDGEWLPNEHGGRENLDAVAFLQEVTATAYKRNPGIVMIAEESTSWPGVTRPSDSGGLGFGLKWNMGWMHDTLQYMHEDPLWRADHHHELTFSFVYAFSENFLLPISHDEVVHGKGSLLSKMPGDAWQRRANVRAFLAFMWGHPGKQLLFMGQEFGQVSEWSEQHGLDWCALDDPAHQGLHRLVGELNRIYRETPALWSADNSPEGFTVIADDPANNVVAFLRRPAHDFGAGGSGSDAVVACIVNFGGAPVGPYRIGLPAAGEWREVLNTDAAEFGGSGVGNLGVVRASAEPWGGQPASAELILPPLGALWLASP
ncbi:MAG TPA: 1,4-alpha-glucan branching protein GlgB [Pseudolysinimonas sp.]|nr:1,4-alpha-glucan branching protein GlgB [Pseudolysinimonas sp.]